MIRTLACRVREASLYSFGLTADPGPPHVSAEHSSVTVRQQMPTAIVAVSMAVLLGAPSASTPLQPKRGRQRRTSGEPDSVDGPDVATGADTCDESGLPCRDAVG
jgi:hypothetical protein